MCRQRHLVLYCVLRCYSPETRLNTARARSVRAAVLAAADSGQLLSRQSLLAVTGIGPKTFEQVRSTMQYIVYHS
jgi:hypothetical protein